MVKKIENRGKKEIVKNPEKNSVEILDPIHKPSPFINFHYSYREISADGGKTRIKSREKSFEDGKFMSEEFDGILPGNVYFNVIAEMQKMFFNQFTTMMRHFSKFLPFSPSDKDKDR